MDAKLLNSELEVAGKKCDLKLSQMKKSGWKMEIESNRILDAVLACLVMLAINFFSI